MSHIQVLTVLEILTYQNELVSAGHECLCILITSALTRLRSARATCTTLPKERKEARKEQIV